MFEISWNEVRIDRLYKSIGGGGAVWLLGLSTALLLLLSLGLHFGTQYVPGDFLASEEKRIVEQIGSQQKSFNDWVSLCEKEAVSESGQWAVAAQQAGLPDWQLQVFLGDSLLYWSQGRLTASDDSSSGLGLIRLPRQFCWRFDTLAGNHRYRFTAPLLIYQSGNWRFCHPDGRIHAGTEPVDILWNGKPGLNDNWHPFHSLEFGSSGVTQSEMEGTQKRAEGQFYWRIANAVHTVQPVGYGLWVARLSLLAAFFFVLLLIELIRSMPISLPRKLVAWIIALIFWRLLLLPVSVICNWEYMSWFDPGLFAAHRLLPSLGDLWLYLLMLWAIPATLVLYTPAQWRSILRPLRGDTNGLISVLLLFCTLSFSTLSWVVTRDLLVNGGIPLSFNELTGLNAFSLPAFSAVVALVLFNTLMWGFWMRTWLIHCPLRVFLIRILLSVTLWLGVLAFTGEGTWIRGLPVLWMPLLLILLFFHLMKNRNSGLFGKWRHAHTGQTLTRVLLVYFSLAAAYQLADGGARRQANRANLLAARLTNPYDERAITELSSMIPRLRADSLLLSGIYGNESSPERWQTLITLGHLTGYLDHYQLVETCFLPDLRPDSVLSLTDSTKIRGIGALPTGENVQNAGSAVKDSLAGGFNTGRVTDSIPEGISLIHQFTDQARQGFGINVPLPIRSGRCDTLYLRLLRRDPVSSGGGVLGLTANRSLGGDEAYPEYSFALYKSGLLQRSNGSISYPLRERDLQQNVTEENGGQNTGVREYNTGASVGLVRFAEHVISSLKDGSSLVVSFRPQDWLDFPAMGITLFLLSWLLILISTALHRLARNKLRWRLGYRERIGLGLVASGLVIVIAGGYSTLAYSVRSREVSQQDKLVARLEDLYTALVPILNEDVLNRTSSTALWFAGTTPPPLRDVVGADDYRLAEIARRMQVDFALYDAQGRLLYSSLPELDRMPFVAQRLEPEAWKAVGREGQSRFVCNHRQSRVDAWSAYRPLFPTDDRLNGVLQIIVPRSDAVGRSEYNAFLGNLLRLYLLLLLFSFLLSYSVARRITRPIRALTLQMMRNRYGEKAPMEGYLRNDEIGLLINSYNELLLELQESARLLAKSEREQTWRQVARQIAHEIRNPLTPMKLKLQRLVRDRMAQPDRFEERFNEDVSVVLEQIDVLAAVSDEFGAFARSEPLKKAVFDLRDGIQPAVALFGQVGEIEFTDHLPSDDSGSVMGDVQQITRVFQNLLRNAQQAVAEGVEPRVRVELGRNGMHYTVLVADNGQGIPESFTDRIFEPNFTTKGSGMGLGLAIVSRIIEQHSGSVSFVTTTENGTTFTLQFPVYEAADPM